MFSSAEQIEHLEEKKKNASGLTGKKCTVMWVKKKKQNATYVPFFSQESSDGDHWTEKKQFL